MQLELPHLFSNANWRTIDVPDYPGPAETHDELQELLDKQRALAQDTGQYGRRERIEREIMVGPRAPIRYIWQGGDEWSAQF